MISLMISLWVQYAIDHNYKHVIILKDLEDKDIYPVYAMSELEVSNVRNNIISESKIRIEKIIDI